MNTTNHIMQAIGVDEHDYSQPLFFSASACCWKDLHAAGYLGTRSLSLKASACFASFSQACWWVRIIFAARPK